jgi:cell division septum initiation protein DivIVA
MGGCHAGWPTSCNSVALSKPEVTMDRGIDFLKSQINNAVMQHGTLVKNLEDHEKQAEDPRYRDLCSRSIPQMRDHQRMLEDFQKQIGAETGVAKNVLGKAMGMARDLADTARESDFLRLVGDIVTARQSQDTFATFREAGRALGNSQLQQIGEVGERHHEQFVRDANKLAQQMFVEHARGVEGTSDVRTTADLGTPRL